MTDIAEPDGDATGGSRRRGALVSVLLIAVFASAGLASTFLGYWSPGEVLSRRASTPSAEDMVVFVDIPTIVLLVPGYQGRNLVLSAKVETSSKYQADVEYMIPRFLDTFNGFLADIDASAYGKRGILDVIRAELMTRASYVVGSKKLKDVLITEFRIQ